MFHLTHFSNKKSMLNFLQTCLVLSRHPLALTDCHVDPHHQLDNFLLASGRKSTRLHLPIVRIVVESRGRVLDRVDTASWKCPLQYSNLNLASLKIEAGDGMITNCQEFFFYYHLYLIQIMQYTYKTHAIVPDGREKRKIISIKNCNTSKENKRGNSRILITQILVQK